MPVIETVHISDLRSYIAQTLRAVNDGIWDVRQGSNAMNAENPKSVDFSVNVLFEWQAQDLRLSTGGGSTTTETNQAKDINESSTVSTGFEKESGEGTERSQESVINSNSGLDTSSSVNTNTHRQKDEENIDGNNDA